MIHVSLYVLAPADPPRNANISLDGHGHEKEA